MSQYNRNYQNNRNMHCKVCADAGKDVSVYSSHRVKDSSGTVTCPTLLSQECRHCGVAGHTVRFCPENKAQFVYQKSLEASKAREERIKAYDLEQAAKKAQEKKTAEVKKVSRFAVLDDSDEDMKMGKAKKVSKKSANIAQPKPAFVSAPAPASAKKEMFSKDAFPTLSGEVASGGGLKLPVLEEKSTYKSMVQTSTPVVAPSVAKKSSWLTPAEALAKMDAWSDEEDDFTTPTFRNIIIEKIAGGGNAQLMPFVKPFTQNTTAKLIKSNQKENWADIYSSDEEDW